MTYPGNFMFSEKYYFSKNVILLIVVKYHFPKSNAL